jgi:GT2 family glycosyltransferase
LFAPFRGACRGWPVYAARFRQREHFTAALSHGMALAADAGSDVLFVSHDMMLTRACVEELFALRDGQVGQGFGVLRPRSGKMDFATKFALTPPTPVRDQADAEAFAQQVRREAGGQVVGWPALIGDAIFIRREVVEKVGGMDRRFYGYWADVDYGVRVQRAGWRHGIAAGAWLHHSGGASGKEDAPTSAEAQRRHEEMLRDSRTAYERFRQKWGEHLLPAEMGELDIPHLRSLRTVPAGPDLGYHPAARLAADLVEEL